MEIKRGDVVYVDLPQQGAHIQYGNRPCIVVQNDIGNKYSPLVIVVPLTSNTTKKNIPTHVIYNRYVQGKAIQNTVLCEQILTIPMDYIKSVKEHCADGVMEQIDEKIKISLGLN